jgi:uncharacterized membrane-anchored protein
MELTKPQSSHSFWHYQFTPAGFTIVVLLISALVALAERILYDLARTVAADNVDYFDNLEVIMVHAIFIIVLLIISLAVNLLIGERREKYALALIPYFVLSITLCLQLALQVAVYFSTHHTVLEFYIVMLALSAVSTGAIYYVQNKYINDSASDNNQKQ